MIIKKHIVCEYHLIENVNSKAEALKKAEKALPYEVEVIEQRNQVESYKVG